MCGVGLRYTVDRENVARIRGVRNPTVKSVVSREAWLRPTRYDIYILYIYIYIYTYKIRTHTIAAQLKTRRLEQAWI